MKTLVLFTLVCLVFNVSGASRKGYWSSVSRRGFGDRRNFKVADSYYKTAKYGNRIGFANNLPHSRSSNTKFFEIGRAHV